MPIFDYSCKGCGHRFDALVLRNETVSCSKCGSTELEKNLTTPALKTEGTHALAMKAAKKRDKRQARDNYWTQRDYERAHYEEDTGIRPPYEETPKKFKLEE